MPRRRPQQLMNTIQYSHQMEVNLNKLEQHRNMQSGIIIMSLGEKSIVAAAEKPQKAKELFVEQSRAYQMSRSLI